MRGILRYLSTFDIWVVTILVAVSMVRTQLLPVAAFAGLFFWLLRLVANGPAGTRTPADLGVALVVVMALLSAFWVSVLPEKTMPQVWRLLAGVGFFYAVANWPRSQAHLRLVSVGLVLLALALALFAPIGVIWAMKLSFIPNAVYERFALLVTDAANPNVLAGSLVIFLPLAPALLWHGWRDLSLFEKALAIVTTLLGTGLLALTQSRAAWMAYALALFLICLLGGRWGWLLAGLGAASAAGIGFVIGGQRLAASLLGSQGGLEGRQAIWNRAVYMLQDFPLTGIGMGLFTDVSDALYPFSQGQHFEHAHNLVLQVGVDLGIPGLIGWLAVLLVGFASAWQLFRFGQDSKTGWLSGLAVGLLAGQAALLLHGVFDAVTWGQVRPAPLVWALWGAAVAAARLVVAEQQRRSSVSTGETADG